MIYHICSRPDWEQAVKTGVYLPDGFEQTGFIHFSFEHQLQATAARFFAGQADLILLEVSERNDLAVRFEPAADSAEIFPHYYAPLPIEKVLRVIDFVREIPRPTTFDHRAFSSIEPQKLQWVEEIIQAALTAVDPYQAMKNHMRLEGNRLTILQDTYDLATFKNIYLIAVGKAAQKMAQAAEDLLGERITKGVILTKHLSQDLQFPEKYRLLIGGHPVPSEGSVTGAEEIHALANSATQNDLVLFLISGGGSALMTLPEQGITLAEMQECSRLLLSSGATIHEFNTVRKHLDRVKGGRLALAAKNATVLTCILSDVIGSPLDIIASGPTVPDPGTYADAFAVIERYGLREKVPASILSALQKGLHGELPETLKPGAPESEHFRSYLLAENRTAAEAAAEKARELGITPLILTTELSGEARQAGNFLSAILAELRREPSFLPKPALVIAGGETTVTLKGNGKGGRNLETALGAVQALSGMERVLLVTLATDGEDGPTDAAGAVVSSETCRRGLEAGLNPESFLEHNDAYNYFDKNGGMIRTGVTGTNVNDLSFLFAF